MTQAIIVEYSYGWIDGNSYCIRHSKSTGDVKWFRRVRINGTLSTGPIDNYFPGYVEIWVPCFPSKKANQAEMIVVECTYGMIDGEYYCRQHTKSTGETLWSRQMLINGTLSLAPDPCPGRVNQVEVWVPCDAPE